MVVGVSHALFAVGKALDAAADGGVGDLEEAIGAGEAVGVHSVEGEAGVAGGGLGQIERAVLAVFGALVLHDGEVGDVELLGLGG